MVRPEPCSDCVRLTKDSGILTRCPLHPLVSGRFTFNEPLPARREIPERRSLLLPPWRKPFLEHEENQQRPPTGLGPRGQKFEHRSSSLAAYARNKKQFPAPAWESNVILFAKRGLAR